MPDLSPQPGEDLEARHHDLFPTAGFREHRPMFELVTDRGGMASWPEPRCNDDLHQRHHRIPALDDAEDEDDE